VEMSANLIGWFVVLFVVGPLEMFLLLYGAALCEYWFTRRKSEHHSCWGWVVAAYVETSRVEEGQESLWQMLRKLMRSPRV